MRKGTSGARPSTATPQQRDEAAAENKYSAGLVPAVVLQSLALDVKVLTENREEIEIKIQDDDMSETAKDIGLLVGDEPALSQTQIAAREVEQQRIAAAAAAAPGLEDGVELPPMEEEEEEDTEATDEEVAAA